MSLALRIPRLARTLLGVVTAGVLVSGCGINTIPTAEENAKARWSDVQNQYQRRADLIPNLVETVKGLCRTGTPGAHRGDGGSRQGQPDQG